MSTTTTCQGQHPASTCDRRAVISERDMLAPNPKEATVSQIDFLSTAVETALTSPCGTRVEGSDGFLLVVNQRLGVEFTEEFDLTGVCGEVVLTGDGRGYDRSDWHRGPEAEWVRVERWTAEGRVFHGFLDSASRRLTQAG